MYDEDESDDEVVREIPVYLSGPSEAADRARLCLLQYPVRAKQRGEEAFCAARVKPENKVLELDAPADKGGAHFDERAPDRVKLDVRTTKSSIVAPATNYAIGTLKKGALYLAPLDETYQMRPSFAHIDAVDPEDALPPAPGAAAAPAPRLQPVSMHKVPTAREVKDQRNTYAAKKAKEDAEAWVPLKLALSGAAASKAKRAKLEIS
mmetsp:Transcript_27745/g.83178  ORF Transcript_27745/g.83178 Transcript_27745/m.83178 type:complete len:207 (-) Transcript_27745:47-667(-)